MNDEVSEPVGDEGSATEEYDVEKEEGFTESSGETPEADPYKEEEEVEVTEDAIQVEGEESPPEFEPQPHSEDEDDMTPDPDPPARATPPGDLRGDISDERSYGPEEPVNSD